MPIAPCTGLKSYISNRIGVKAVCVHQHLQVGGSCEIFIRDFFAFGKNKRILFYIVHFFIVVASRKKGNHKWQNIFKIILRHSLYFKGWFDRSEEHTSELQSLMRISYAVFCF